MLIDEYLPSYDFVENHEIVMDASVDRVWSALRSVNFGGSTITRVLLLLRGLPMRTLTLDGLLRYGFVVLEERSEAEILLGLVGRFWLPTGGVERIEPYEFAGFDRPGFAKTAWNFSLARGEGLTKVSTETRIKCTDQSALRLFRFYWTMVRPFSGIMRIQMLRAIKQEAEAG